MFNRLILVLAIVPLVLSGEASELQGAKEVLKRLPIEPSGQEPASASAVLLDDIQRYREERVDLSPQERASQWLSLAMRTLGWGQVEQMEAYASVDSLTSKPVGLESVMASLPSPEAWTELVEAVGSLQITADNAMSIHALRFLAASLVGDTQTQVDSLQELESLSEDQPVEVSQFSARFISQLKIRVAAITGDTESVLKQVEFQLRNPDVYALLGEQAAVEWLSKQLAEAKASLKIPVGDQTRRIAKELAFEMLDELLVPHWGLVDGLDVVNLYEGLEERFSSYSPPSGYDIEREAARIYYLLSLIAANRTEAAADFAGMLATNEQIVLSKDTLHDLERAGFTDETQSFLQARRRL